MGEESHFKRAVSALFIHLLVKLLTSSLLSIHPHSLNFASVVVYNMCDDGDMTKTMGVFEVVLLLSQKKVMVKPSIAACGFPSILDDSAKQQQEVQEGIKSGKDRVTQKRVASCPELHLQYNISVSLQRRALCGRVFKRGLSVLGIPLLVSNAMMTDKNRLWILESFGN